MASGSITSWQIEGGNVEVVTSFLFLLLKSLWMVTAAMKSEDIASWQENYDKSRQHVKSRDVTLLTKVHIVKVMVFSVVTYGCESTKELMPSNCDAGEES